MNSNPEPDRFKTSVLIVGERQVDEFQALCLYLGRRPHQLAADMVLAEIRRYRRRKNVAEFVALMVKLRRQHRAETGALDECVDLNAYRWSRRG